MSPLIKNSSKVKELVERSLSITKYIFYVPPIVREWVNEKDFNRIHDEAESKTIDNQIPELLSQYPDAKPKLTMALGNTNERI